MIEPEIYVKSANTINETNENYVNYIFEGLPELKTLDLNLIANDLSYYEDNIWDFIPYKFELFKTYQNIIDDVNLDLKFMRIQSSEKDVLRAVSNMERILSTMGDLTIKSPELSNYLRDYYEMKYLGSRYGNNSSRLWLYHIEYLYAPFSILKEDIFDTLNRLTKVMAKRKYKRNLTGEVALYK